MKQETIQIKQAFQKEFDMFKNNIPNAQLNDIFEVYLPFWQCKQKVVIDKSLALDRFSIILMQAIDSGLILHSDLCLFLGIEENSFVLMQIHYLIKNELIKEIEKAGEIQYEITRDGVDFMQNKKKITMTEIFNFNYCYNDILQSFFTESCSIAEDGESINLEELIKNENDSLKYIVAETKRLDKNINLIPHKNKPYNINKVEFARFFNKQHKDKVFYDIECNSQELHKRSICFLAFEYIDESNTKIYEIRHFKKTIRGFKKYSIETELSKKVNEYYKKHPRVND